MCMVRAQGLKLPWFLLQDSSARDGGQEEPAPPRGQCGRDPAGLRAQQRTGELGLLDSALARTGLLESREWVKRTADHQPIFLRLLLALITGSCRK